MLSTYHRSFLRFHTELQAMKDPSILYDRLAVLVHRYVDNNTNGRTNNYVFARDLAGRGGGHLYAVVRSSGRSRRATSRLRRRTLPSQSRTISLQYNELTKSAVGWAILGRGLGTPRWGAGCLRHPRSVARRRRQRRRRSRWSSRGAAVFIDLERGKAQ
jgi:hypothetical protein